MKKLLRFCCFFGSSENSEPQDELEKENNCNDQYLSSKPVSEDRTPVAEEKPHSVGEVLPPVKEDFSFDVEPPEANSPEPTPSNSVIEVEEKPAIIQPPKEKKKRKHKNKNRNKRESKVLMNTELPQPQNKKEGVRLHTPPSLDAKPIKGILKVTNSKTK